MFASATNALFRRRHFETESSK